MGQSPLTTVPRVSFPSSLLPEVCGASRQSPNEGWRLLWTPPAFLKWPGTSRAGTEASEKRRSPAWERTSLWQRESGTGLAARRHRGRSGLVSGEPGVWRPTDGPHTRPAETGPLSERQEPLGSTSTRRLSQETHSSGCHSLLAVSSAAAGCRGHQARSAVTGRAARLARAAEAARSASGSGACGPRPPPLSPAGRGTGRRRL